MNRSIFAAAAALAAVASISAATPTFARSATVAFGDLDLASSAGQARLDTRIRSAVRSVCEASGSNRSLTELRATARCIRETSEAARIRVAAARSDSRFGG